MNAYTHEHTVRTQDPGYLAQHTTPPTSSRPAWSTGTSSGATTTPTTKDSAASSTGQT